MRNPVTRLRSFAGLLLLPVLPFSGCLNDGGTEIPNEVKGTLYTSAGTPAANAQIALVHADHVPGSGSDSGKFLAETDLSGRYAIGNVPDGYYNVLASGGGNVAFRDSVLVDGGAASVPPDTLRAAGTLTATVQLQPQHSPQTATVQVLGTESYVNVPASGTFTLTLPQGTHRLRVAVSLPEYTPLFRTVTVTSGANDTITEPLVPFFSGIPAVTGVTATADSSGRIHLRWKASGYASLRHYRVYRTAAGSLDPGTVVGTTTDTIWIDTIFAQAFGQDPGTGRFPYTDTTPRSYDYRVRVESLTDEVGLAFGAATATARAAGYYLDADSNRWHLAPQSPPWSSSGSVHGMVIFQGALLVFDNTRAWRSTDGTTWQAMDALPFTSTVGSHFTVHKDTLWAMTSYSTGSMRGNALYKSADATNWDLVSSTVPLPGLTNSSVYWPAFLSFEDSLRVVGGFIEQEFEPVWANRSFASADGTTWNATVHSEFVSGSSDLQIGMVSARRNIVAFQGALWMVGGDGSEYLGAPRVIGSSIYRSLNGVTWSQVATPATAPFLPRGKHALAVHDGKLWAIGGHGTSHSVNEVWTSTDGIAWVPSDLNPPFDTRVNAQAVSFNGRLWIFGGQGATCTASTVNCLGYTSVERNDIWYYE